MQLEINAYVSSLCADSNADQKLESLRSSLRILADAVVSMDLGLIIEVRDVRRATTVHRIVCYHDSALDTEPDTGNGSALPECALTK